MKEFFNESFCKFLLKTHIVGPEYVFASHCWINMKISKVCWFCQHFVLKNDHNFKSYQNMLTTLGFSFLYYKLQLCLICHEHHTPFACGKRILKMKDFETYFEFKNISNAIKF
jgi:hypothetical protein